MNPEPSEGEPGASQVFEAWLVRRASGQAEPFERLLAQHPDLRASLEVLQRADAECEAAMPRSLPLLPAARQTLGDFKVLRKLGEGAMGVVYEAEQVSLRRRVALKVLKPELVLNGRALQRFLHEAEITGRLQHPNIIAVHQVGEFEGTHFISMELVEGTSLERLIERMRHDLPARTPVRPASDVVEVQGLEDAGSLPAALRAPARVPGSKRGSSAVSNKSYIETAVRLVCQVADALDHAHRAGVLHRDVKPSNVLVRTSGEAVLTDFGLAREEGLPTLSQSGDFVGTAHYVSPEQAMSGRVPVDARSDVFSLGATLYELLTLELAFPGDSLHAVLAGVVSRPPRDPSQLNPALAPDLVTILLKALEKDPDQRYSSAGELAEDLRAFVDYRPIRARRTPTVVRALRWVRREPLKAFVAVLLVLGGPLLAFLGWTAISAQRAASASERERRLERIPDLLDHAFLALGVGDRRGAEGSFLEVRAQDPASIEGAAGQVLALLAESREAEALGVLEEAERAVGPSALLGRLRVHALRRMRRTQEALALERELPPLTGHLDRFIGAMLLLQDSPFLSGAPSPGILLVPSASAAGASGERAGSSVLSTLAWGEPSSDTFVQARERANEAIELLTRAIDSESDRAMYHFARAWAVWLTRDRAAASRAVDAILDRWSELPVARFYAGLAAEVIDPNVALTHYEAALALDPDLETALARRANLNLRRGELELCLTQLEELVASFPERVSHRVNLASARIEAGQLDAALAAARSAIERDPAYVPAQDALGTAYYRKGELALAEEAYRKAVELEPQGARLWNDLGVVQQAQGRLDASEASLERAHELAPEDAFAAYNLGFVAFQQDEFTRAADWFSRGIALLDSGINSEFPAHVLYGALGKALQHAHQSPLEAYQRAVELAPDDGPLNAELGLALWSLQRCAEAIEPLQKALAVDRDGSVHRALFQCRLLLGEAGAALAVAVAWSEGFSSSFEAWNYRAWLQVDPCRDLVGDPRDGLAAAERARALAAEDYHVLDTYACALLLNQRPKEARDFTYEALDRAEANGVDGEIRAEMQRHLQRIEAAAE